MTRTVGLAAAVAYLSCIVVANWLVNTYGVVPVGFGLSAPAGVYAVGVAFTLRDITQRLLGLPATLVAIVIGIGLSCAVSPRLALASGVAFGVSELVDLSIYTPLNRDRFVLAVVASNVVGAAVDSILFLWIAFGSLGFFRGQMVGKLAMTALAVPIVWRVRRALPVHAVHPADT